MKVAVNAVRSPRRGPASQVIAAGAPVVLGLVYGALAVGEGLGTLADTGAGFFPLLVAIVLVAAGVVVLLQSRGEPPATDAEPADDASDRDDDTDDTDDRDDDVHWWRIAGVLAAALVVPVVGETVGMITTLSISLIVIAKIMGVARWSNAVILGAAFGAATWLIFVRWLLVPLPSGVLGLV
ncbi:tripartite tricarboxylate transporter TctB family protein [Thermopolyspora sp. NPDC052614]|uniref:tripartite tricarboxylate transporter TctB family protein n=1 Tax=Thermopolyspora sp. NPDC052614 TaxID=3155682 RepID=UPI00343E5A69